MEVADLVHPDDVIADTAAFQRVIHGHVERMETRRRTLHSSGQTLRTIASHFTIAGMDGPLYACLIRDITTQVEAETVKQAEAAMYSAASDIASAESVEQALPTVLKALCHSSGWVLGAFWRVDVQTQLLHCRSVWQDMNETAPHALFNRHTTYALA
jgi:PAS domain-containing protein